MKLLTYIIVAGGLFATLTNLVPLSLLPFFWALVLLPVLGAKLFRVHKITAWALLYYVISLTSLLIYDPVALITPEFYRYDGNFLVSFLPLLILPVFGRNGNYDVGKAVKIFVVLSVIVCAPVVVYQELSQGSVSGLFFTTNAFGGFLMAVIAFSVAWLIGDRHKKVAFLALVLSSTMLVLSLSRGSLLGICLGIVSLWALKSGRSWVISGMIGSIVLVQGAILSVTYPVYVASGGATFELVQEIAGSLKEMNILIRAYENWPRGLYLFFHSPLVGAGVGSVNDVPFQFEHQTGIQFNGGPNRDYNDAHAHHTYVHLLAEQGVVGLLVFLGMWRAVFRAIRENRRQSMVGDGLTILFWALTFASFTEHRIPSPSNAFPFILIFVLYFCSSRGAVRKSTGVGTDIAGGSGPRGSGEAAVRVPEA